MNKSAVSIEQALVDVRKAYRLLHDYQRMVLDALNHIAQQFGLTYGGGWPKFSEASPRLGRGSLDLWAWDWLNLVQYDFHFTRGLGARKTLMLSMLLISDTGYFCSKQEGLEATDTSAFLPAEQSRTMIGFVISTTRWKPEFMEDREAMRMFIETGGGLPPEFADERIVTRCYDLTRLVDDDSTNALIDELVAVASAAGIPLQRVAE